MREEMRDQSESLDFLLSRLRSKADHLQGRLKVAGSAIRHFH